MAADPYERGMAGSWKVFAFTKEETRSFKWYGPRIGDKDERAWKQTCDVSVDKDFNSDKIIEFRLQADAEGLGDTTKREDPKHSGKVTIKCKDAECSLPDGRECKDENVIPHVDLTV
uniref:Uncharacterized protein n=1 Tax=Kwoniella bestiolae CBS 10118 TaxID=1296100 RepID=A0A1B9FZ08_9TREE|nr:hypothetical protein I302_06999 [Kwoniella bestiolae CBS 10118]OCF24013.1 hypothetical protein I302_06999 [Kwoniella bestiolae CBS 10118]